MVYPASSIRRPTFSRIIEVMPSGMTCHAALLPHNSMANPSLITSLHKSFGRAGRSVGGPVGGPVGDEALGGPDGGPVGGPDGGVVLGGPVGGPKLGGAD